MAIPPDQRQQRGKAAGREAQTWVEHSSDAGLGNSDIDRRELSGPEAAYQGRIFPPDPSSQGWHEIIAEQPWLAPAIKPGLFVLVDGVPVVVDEARAHQLRAAGNGVVSIQAAVALRALLARFGG